MQMRTHRTNRMVRIGVVLGVALSFTSMTSVPASAFNQVVIDQMQHYFDCKVLLLTDPVAHAAQCLPNNVPKIFGTIETLHSVNENHLNGSR